ncbi:nucleotidyltransferase domain-containing protein [Flammeovirga sp. EKP202]|uniref:nucleotidyltransferase domain-containing protein n=1 Tax=Flammeovirga sp. EKP202 TaxID=2770592 RepID=UPI00165F782C|nr:nucleotidyltransferase domain-containing protein [Flammeovirga sp. EKP202]MBD0401699.1 nucleotidyltransferase domain-containing protein [Flammeovirga sp. EKP202]
MRNRIIKYLDKLEEENNIKILLACETGSRAWGFASPDSDFDVRLIYVHKTDWYLGLSEKRDFIDAFYQEKEIDICGWDLKKSLQLLAKSNASIFERIGSPYVYKEAEGFRASFLKLSEENYSKIASIHHYLGLANNAMKELREHEAYKLKKLFYALRATLACLWVLEKDVYPPMKFEVMLNDLELPVEVKNKIVELLRLKTEKEESYRHFGEEALLGFIEERILSVKGKAKSLPASNGNYESLERFFKTTVKQYNDN